MTVRSHMAIGMQSIAIIDLEAYSQFTNRQANPTTQGNLNSLPIHYQNDQIADMKKPNLFRLG